MTTRLALIGGGEIAASYTTVAPRFTNAAFVAVVDPQPDRAQAAADSLGASITANSLEKLLERGADAFDAVIISESNHARSSLALQAAEAGKHVLTASPLAPSVEDAEKVVDACRSADVRLMASSSLRFMPSHQAVKNALAEGKLGEPGLLRMHRWSQPSGPNSADDIVLGGSVVGIDLALWMFGGSPTEVYAVGRPGYAQVHLGFPDGGMALIDEARTLPDGDGYLSLSLIGSTGAAYADDHHNRNLVFRGGDPSAIDTSQGSAALTAQLEEFVSAVEEGREPAASGAENRTALQVAEAAVTSLQSQQALRLNGGSYELA